MHSRTRSLPERAAAEESGGRAPLLDLLGTGLIVAAGAWMVWARVKSGGAASPGVALLAGCGLVIIAARRFGQYARLVVPAAALVSAVAVAAGSKTSITSIEPLAGPFGYLNADGAFYVQAAIAAFMVACSAPSWPIRALGGAGAAFFSVLPFIVHTVAAATLVLLLPAIALGGAVFAGGRAARVSIGLLAALFVGAMTASVVLGATYSTSDTPPSRLQRAAFSTIGKERVTLWHDAFAIMREHPRTGVGPGRFQVVSPIGSRDPDFRWAHNEFLQQGAEGGVTGLVLLAALFGWGFTRLLMVKGPDIVTALSAASLAALGIHACVDYVMHFPAIPLMTAGLVAAGMIDRVERASEPAQALEQNDLTQAPSRS